MTPIPSGWKITSRDDETHRLDWGEDNPQLIEEKRKKLKEKIIKLNEKMGNNINLKEEYPTLFNE
ncbi:MAG: hypothetical protein IJG09_10060 [Methanobrevibacter sp.]|nr:hypothetical protein [Methanobrevibacter sp.]